MRLSVRMSPKADDDYFKIMQRSALRFGPMTMRRYDELIRHAMYDLMDDPHRHGSQARFDLRNGLYFYYLKYSKRSVLSKAERILHPRHIIAYRLPSATELHIIRILHERMKFSDQEFPIEYIE